MRLSEAGARDGGIGSDTTWELSARVSTPSIRRHGMVVGVFDPKMAGYIVAAKCQRRRFGDTGWWSV